MSEHSIIPPSSAHIWGSPNGCTGWVMMAQLHPEDGDSESAMEGTASHQIGEELILQAIENGEFAGDWSTFDGKCADNGVMYEYEMFEGAELYADDFLGYFAESGVTDPQFYGVESRVKCPSIHELSYGTVDAWLYDPNTSNLHVWDYKFGHELVEAEENYQCANYAVGLLEQLNPINPNIKIVFHIIQPRAYHHTGSVRVWETDMRWLMQTCGQLNRSAHVALSGNGVLHSGPHCKHCQARHDCSAALEAGMSLYEVTRDIQPLEMSNAALGAQLTIIKRAKKHIESLDKAYEERVLHRMSEGHHVAGWNQVKTKGRLKWDEHPDTVKAVTDMMGFDIRKEESLITPTQAIAKAKKNKVDSEVIRGYCTHSESLKLTPEKSDKAKKVFTK